MFLSSLLYGYTQELLVTNVFGKRYPIFISACTFVAYGVYSGMQVVNKSASSSPSDSGSSLAMLIAVYSKLSLSSLLTISSLRSANLLLTNIAMGKVHYTVKVLIKSSKVVFTMIFASIIMKKRHKPMDYVAVSLMALGLSLFIYGDSKTTATGTVSVMGVGMLILSNCFDGVSNNNNERLMTSSGSKSKNRGALREDELLFATYSIAGLMLLVVALFTGELRDGLGFVLTSDEGGYRGATKCFVLILYVTAGFIATTFSATITKSFGAVSMSTTSTVTKAGSLFLSFVCFPKGFEVLHGVGMFVFGMAVVLKSYGKNNKNGSGGKENGAEMEMGVGVGGTAGHFQREAPQRSASGSEKTLAFQV
jgi:adenosine 3'-phospho 5'-phosphosulfate transporter B3